MCWCKFAKWKVDLSQSIVKPVALQKLFNIYFISNHYWRVPFVMMRMSSTKRRCRILMLLETFIPDILPSSCLVLRSSLNASIAQMNRRGERGQPFRSTMPIRKKEEDSPLTKMEMLSLTTQPMIHLIIDWLNPVWARINLRKSQSMQLKSFLRSNSRISGLEFFDLILWRHS